MGAWICFSGSPAKILANHIIDTLHTLGCPPPSASRPLAGQAYRDGGAKVLTNYMTETLRTLGFSPTNGWRRLAGKAYRGGAGGGVGGGGDGDGSGGSGGSGGDCRGRAIVRGASRGALPRLTGVQAPVLIWASGEWPEGNIHAPVDLLQGNNISVGGFHFRGGIHSRRSRAGRCFDGISGRHFSARTIAPPPRCGRSTHTSISCRG